MTAFCFRILSLKQVYHYVEHVPAKNLTDAPHFSVCLQTYISYVIFRVTRVIYSELKFTL